MKKTSFRPGTLIVAALLAIGAVVLIMPFIWMLFSSVKSSFEIMSVPPSILPRNITFVGYQKLFTKSPVSYWFMNSVTVAVSVVFAQLITSSLLGYVFAKFEFRGRNILFVLVLATTMIPFQSIMIPVYLICSALKIVNTLWVLIIPSIVSAFGTFLCRQLCQDVPSDLMDAARLDGAGEFAIYWRVIVPSIKTGLSTLAIFTFMSKWNEYVWPLIAINESKRMTLPLALSWFNQMYTQDYNAIMCACVVMVLPVIITFLLFQRQFMEGLTLSGIK